MNYVPDPLLYPHFQRFLTKKCSDKHYNKWLPVFPPFSEFLLLSMASCCMEYHFGWLRSAVLVVSLLKILSTPSLVTRVGDMVEKRKCLDAVHAFSAIREPWLSLTNECYQHWFSYKPEVQHHKGCCEESLSQTDPGQHPAMWLTFITTRPHCWLLSFLSPTVFLTH